ncbi:NAD-dependent succinate-semialdehyde dehydrogenase [Pelagibacterium montanilacus]|uniref:NAD-dependent succinate-semialdehyde dehydrogenase n=1 Tax=Pelagibacterium montanilacus TaxID=2185280 RepID=UPI000F8F7501|nr:NAD-dependent succinate-semialdehyde dehydrogenase [Pelagibacterium montanilacus]
MLKSINPANDEVLATLDRHSDADVEAALARAAKTQREWRNTAVSERSALLKRIAEVLREGKSEYARTITLEMGKPIGEALAEVEKCAWNCDYYAETAEAFLAPEHIKTPASESYVSYEPLGIVLAIMPWNYPFWQVFRCLAPIIAGGNGYVLKHASNVPQCARAVEDIARRAGAPDGLVTTLLIGAGAVEGLIDDDRISAVTLTGSTEVGSLVAAQAGRRIKKQVLELGGSDPFIVLADADLDKAAATALKARFHNAGQSCISPKRFIVENAVADRFVDAMAAGIDKLVVGDPIDPEVGMGPMARTGLRGDLHEIVEATAAAGGKLVRGGKPTAGAGAFYQATLIDGVAAGMASFDKETFGPVASVVRASGPEQAIELANRTEFGLGGALWTSDIDRAKRLVRDLEVGAVFINAMVASDPRMPFGGIKQSGYGRELGPQGIREFTNVKTNWIA